MVSSEWGRAASLEDASEAVARLKGDGTNAHKVAHKGAPRRASLMGASGGGGART